MEKVDFRLQIKILIERNKISIAKISRLADLHQDTMYKYLREESEISAANLEKLFNVLNTLSETGT